ncbi:MAG: hypothetical protein AAF806_08065, partial [Bacteroidota bacterium]
QWDVYPLQHSTFNIPCSLFDIQKQFNRTNFCQFPARVQLMNTEMSNPLSESGFAGGEGLQDFSK